MVVIGCRQGGRVQSIVGARAGPVLAASSARVGTRVVRLNLDRRRPPKVRTLVNGLGPAGARAARKLKRAHVAARSASVSELRPSAGCPKFASTLWTPGGETGEARFTCYIQQERARR